MGKIYLIVLSFLFLALFISNSYSQINEKNRILFKNHQVNPDSFQTIFLNQTKSSKSILDEINEDPKEPPFIKTDFLVNSLDGNYGSDQNSISSAIDGNGNYAFTWLDYRNGKKEIYAQFYDSNDTRTGTNFKVTENDLTGNNSPFIAANKNGDFIITWLQDFNAVMAQRFTKDGQKLGGNFKVNLSWGMNTMEPSVCVNNDGSFLVMWASEPGNWNFQVYARLFDKFANPVTSEIYVSEEGYDISSIGRGKYIAADTRGNYCISWSSYANTNFSNIILQIISSEGLKVGVNTLITNLSDSSDNFFPGIVSTDDGYFLIVWDKNLRYQIESGVSARIYHSNSYFVTDELTISEPDVFTDAFNISSDKESTFLITYLGTITPYFQKISKTGEFLGDTVRINYNSNITDYVYLGELTGIYNNHFFIVTYIYERNDPNIYLQKYNTNFEPMGSFNKIHDDYASSWQRKPLVKFNSKGEAIVLWEDRKNGRYDLYAQVYDKDFNPVGNNIQINETNAERWFLNDKKVQCLSDGTFAIIFKGSETYSDNNSIFLQLINTAGKKVGQNKLVKEGDYYSDYKLELSINSKDEILICWYDLYGAYIKKYDKNLSPLSTEINFIKYSSPITFNPFTISIDTAFNIFSVWKDYDIQTSAHSNKIKGKFFNGNGNATSGIFVIDSSGSFISNLTCKNDNKNYAVIYKNDYGIYLKRKYMLDNEYLFENVFPSYGYTPTQINIIGFDNQKIFLTYNSLLDVIGFFANDNKRKEELYKLHTYDYINNFYDEYNGTNSMDIFNDKLIFTYESSTNSGTGYDIWSNIRKIENIDFGNENFLQPVTYDILYPNYPNPFNPKTNIAYEILAYHKVKLAIYDVLGREIKVLVNENQEKGLYEVEFDASGLASGIYFYRLEAFNTNTKKMILMR
jgi:hypothetical protein